MDFFAADIYEDAGIEKTTIVSFFYGIANIVGSLFLVAISMRVNFKTTLVYASIL